MSSLSQRNLGVMEAMQSRSLAIGWLCGLFSHSLVPSLWLRILQHHWITPGYLSQHHSDIIIPHCRCKFVVGVMLQVIGSSCSQYPTELISMYMVKTYKAKTIIIYMKLYFRKEFDDVAYQI